MMNSPNLDTPIPNFVGVEDFIDIQDRFIKSARALLTSYYLDLDGGQHRWPITALELYLHHPDKWRDPTAHGVRFPKVAAARQLEAGTWYIHRVALPPTDPTARSGYGPGPNRSGIDITAGAYAEGIMAGILIAALGADNGSATALKTIVRANAPERMAETSWSVEDKEFMAEINGSALNSGRLRLVQRKTTDQNVWIGARKGLPATLSEPFKRSFLRLSTLEKSPVPMKRLREAHNGRWLFV